MLTTLCRAAALAAAVTCAVASPAFADESTPGAPARRGAAVLEDRRKATLVVEPTDLGREVELILPRQMKPGAAGVVSTAPSPTRTVVAGIALSFALASAGLWASRSRRSPAARGAAAAIAITAVVAGAGGYALGNYSPYADADAKPGTLREARPPEELRGEVRVLYASEDGAVHLRIPRKVFQEQ